MGLSPLGIFHTIVGVAAIVAGLIGIVRAGKIDLDRLTGKTYFYCTLVTSLTALGIYKHGGFNPGHGLSIIVILLLSAAYFLHSRRKGNNRSRYFENFFLSFSFFLSWVPTVNETLTRVPVGHPLAKDITDPLIGKTLAFILVLFVVGSILQFRRQWKVNKSAGR